jgi:hypothetical protein
VSRLTRGRHATCNTPRGVCSTIRVKVPRIILKSPIDERYRLHRVRVSPSPLFFCLMTSDQQRLVTLLSAIGIRRVTFLTHVTNATQAETQATQAAACRGRARHLHIRRLENYHNTCCDQYSGEDRSWLTPPWRRYSEISAPLPLITRRTLSGGT